MQIKYYCNLVQVNIGELCVFLSLDSERKWQIKVTCLFGLCGINRSVLGLHVHANVSMWCFEKSKMWNWCNLLQLKMFAELRPKWMSKVDINVGISFIYTAICIHVYVSMEWTKRNNDTRRNTEREKKKHTTTTCKTRKTVYVTVEHLNTHAIDITGVFCFSSSCICVSVWNVSLLDINKHASKV